MDIQYIGSDSGYQVFKQIMMQEAKVTTSNSNTDITVYEVSSIENLYKIPKKFEIPTYFYITTQDPAVLVRIKGYSINGILVPPINPTAVIAKIRHYGANKVKRNLDDYSNLRIKILAKAENIPPLPDLANQLIKLTKSDSSTMSQVTDKIKRDQAIATRVIKLINSPFYGVRQEIASIDRATVLLGFKSVKNLALAISIDGFYSKPFNMFKTTGKNMWMHSYKVACICQEIAKELSIEAEPLYMAGLLHDIGKVVIVDFLVKEVGNIEEEKEQLGIDHADAGSIILKKWEIAPAITEAVRTHHDFNSSLFGQIVFYANKIDNNQIAAEEIIDEMGIVFGIANIERFKVKITTFLSELHGEI